jgi:hypothetical protein
LFRRESQSEDLKLRLVNLPSLYQNQIHIIFSLQLRFKATVKPVYNSHPWDL